MLSHYPALKVAEQFRMLALLHPGRIDLGIGRAPGADQRTARALRLRPEALDAELFPEQAAQLVGFLHDALPPAHPLAGIRAMPVIPDAPELWLLGSTDGSAACAAHFGTAFSFAHFINADGGAAVTRAYARRFPPSPGLARPGASVATFALSGDTEAEARALAGCRALSLLRL
jgi:luciferase family oxidoreductase group 1